MAVVAELDLKTLDTWPKVLVHNGSSFGSRKAMRYKHYGIWQSYTWAQYAENVKYLALGLMSLGFQPGDRLLIVGDNSAPWYFAELAAQCNRGVSVGLYSDLSAAELQHIAADCGAQFAMVEDQEQADKVMAIRDRLPALKAVVYWRYKGLGDVAEQGFLFGLRSVMEAGRSYEQEHPGTFEQNVAAGSADDVCAVIYTSGTGGRPKGAVHSYRSLMANAQMYHRLDRLTHHDDLVSYLPPAWITEQCLVFGGHLLCGGVVDFPENSETQQEDVREIAPSFVVYNSRLWEAQAGQVRAKLQAASWLKSRFIHWFMPVGLRAADLRERKATPSLGLRILDALGDLLVFRKIRDSLGLTKARVCYTTGASMAPETVRYFHALRVPLRNIYSTTEAGSVTGVLERVQRPWTLGSVMEGIDVRITEQGEIVVRHPGSFLGYYNDPEATAAVLREGWVYTGDCGRLEDGQLIFVDRLCDLIAMPSGDTVPPQEIAARLKHSPYIKDAWVFGCAGGASLSAVVIIDAANTGHWADKKKVAYTTFGDLSQKDEVYGLIEREIETVNQQLPEHQRIRRYVDLHKEFDPDEAELTRNRKLRRATLGTRYALLAQALCGDSSAVEVEAEFTYQDGRTTTLRTPVKLATIGRGEA